VPQPYTHSQNISWKVDDQTVGTGNNFTLNTSNLTVGTHTVEVMVNDPTTMVRNDPMQVLKESWKWDVVITISNITPMTWATTPYPTGTTLIAMVATAINDPFPPINYFFDFTDSPTGGTGGVDSGWQSGTTYINSGLQANHQYGYQVKARDGANYETAYSIPIRYVYTAIEESTGITFGAVTSSSIQVQSTNTPSGLARGSSGLLIENMTKATNSGWKRDNNFWTSSSLSPNMSYSFRAKTRNGNSVETGYSSTFSKYTLAKLPVAASFSNVTQNCIRANWTANGNPGGTQYYCENTTKGTNSGWTTNLYWDSCELVCGVSYSFQVKARNGDGIETGWTSLGSRSTVVCPPPPPPTNVQASDGVSPAWVRVTWTASPNTDSYTVYRATSTSRRATKVLLGTTGTTTYEDTTASVMVNYYYYVTASNIYGMSGYSAYDTGYRSDGRPPAPTNISASDGAYMDRVQVTWTASPEATSYTVYRATSTSRRATKVLLGTTGTTTYEDTTASVMVNYYYYVTASNTYGMSGYSAYDTGYRSDGRPPPPTNVQATDGTYTDKVQITWTASPDATSYTIYRATSTSRRASKVAIGTASETNYDDSTALAGKTYYYYVTASNTYGTSGFSAYDTGYR
jgi:fibronectin type 3 domain-containing protein